MKIISVFLFLLFLPVVAAAEATTKKETTNSRIRTNLKTWYSAPSIETLDFKNEPELKRVTPWGHYPISIQCLNGEHLLWTLHFAEFTSSKEYFIRGGVEKRVDEYKQRVTLITSQEGKKHKVRWLGITSPKDIPSVFEMDGELLSPSYSSGELHLSGGILWELEFNFSFADRESEWETPLMELLAGEVKVSNRRFRFNGFHPSFDKRGLWDNSTGGLLHVRYPMIQKGVLRIDVRNPNPGYPRKGRIWLDLRSKKVLKTEDTTEQKIWDEQNRVFGVWPRPELSKKASTSDSYRVGDREYKLMP